MPPEFLGFPSLRGHSGCLDRIAGALFHDLGASGARLLTKVGSFFKPLWPRIYFCVLARGPTGGPRRPRTAQEAPNGRAIFPGFGGMRVAIQSAAPLAGAGRFIIMLEIQSIPQTWGSKPPPSHYRPPPPPSTRPPSCAASRPGAKLGRLLKRILATSKTHETP